MDDVAKKEIPADVWLYCKGVCVITATEAGFVFSYGEGDGIVIKKNDDGTWGAPSACMVTGFGAGAVFGKAKKQVILFPMTEHDLRLLCSKNKFDVGGQLGLAIGKLGRETSIDVGVSEESVGLTYSYIFEDGVYLNVGANNYILSSVDQANTEYYGKQAEAHDIVLDKPDTVTIPKDKGTEELHEKLASFLK